MGKKRRIISSPRKFGAKHGGHPALLKTTETVVKPVVETAAEVVTTPVVEATAPTPTLKTTSEAKTSVKVDPWTTQQKGIKKKSTK